MWIVASVMSMSRDVEMDNVGDVEVTFGDDHCGALGLAQGATCQRHNMFLDCAKCSLAQVIGLCTQIWFEEDLFDTPIAHC